MKTFFSLPLFLLICLFMFPIQAYAETDNDSLQYALEQLDATIHQKSVYRRRCQATADSLRRAAVKTHGPVQVENYMNLAAHYSRFQTDSTLHYLSVLKQCPEYEADSLLRLRVAIRYADVYAVVGLYITAEDILRSADVSQADPDTRLSYFHTCRTVYGWMADYASVEEFSERYHRLTDQYRDSILTYQSPGIGRNIVLADYLLGRHEPDSALAVLLADLKTVAPSEKTFIYYNIAQGYRQKGRLSDYQYYLALTAQSDIERGVTEYVALPELASLVFDRGDLNRAYTYMLCSLEDANYCKARLRSLEVGTIFPIIEHAYNAKEHEQHRRERLFIYTFAVLALLLLVMVFRLRFLVKKVASSRRKLGRANAELMQVGRLKEEYITYYLGQCRNHIDALDKFRATLLRMVKYKQLDELQKTLIKSDSLVEEQHYHLLNQFDKAFLDLHPNFVEGFNALFPPECSIQLHHRGVLTTELRIFALIRLGMNDTADIAKFLNYSTTTIYNYRSRIRSNSLYGKDEFNKRLMAL